KTVGPEHPQTAQCLENLGHILARGDPRTARPLFERALAIFEKTLGAEHPRTARILNNLAHALDRLGDLAAARPLYERALTTYERVLGPEHRETAKARDNLALLLGDLSEPEAAWNLARDGWSSAQAHLARTIAALTEGERYRYLSRERGRLE